MALTPEQASILATVRATTQGTVQDVIEYLGQPQNYESYIKVGSYLANAGENLPLTRGENQGNLAREAMAKNQTKELTEWQQTAYQYYVSKGMNAYDIANEFNAQGIPIRVQDVQDIVKAAGLQLGGQLPLGPSDPALNPQPPEYEGGLPGRQPQGGMYGVAGRDNTPSWGVGTAIPRHPALGIVFSQARRENAPGWSGTTETINTSGRGVKAPATISRPVLTGR